MGPKDFDCDSILRGIDTAVGKVAEAMGPGGKPVRIDNGIYTRDGHRIACSVELPGSGEQYGVKLVQAVTGKMANDVGDGSSTAAVLMRSLVGDTLPKVARGDAAPGEVDEGMRLAIAKAIGAIEEQSLKVDVKKAFDIATVHAGLGDDLARKLARSYSGKPLRVKFGSASGVRFTKNGIIVGGDDADEKKRRIENLFKFVDLNLQTGVVRGNGRAYLRAARALDDLEVTPGQRIGVEAVRKALMQPHFRILQNVRVDDTHEIFDATAMVRTALQNAALTTSEAIRATSKRPPEALLVTPTTPPPIVTRYTDIYCPRRVSIKSEQFPVIVGLTVAKRSEQTQKLDVRSDQPVRVVVQATGCEPLEKPEKEIAILEGEDSRATFFFRPKTLGIASIRVLISQQGQLLASPVAELEITAFDVSDEAASVQTPLQTVDFKDPPDHCLYVEYDSAALRYMWMPASGQARMFTQPLGDSLRRVMKRVYEQLEGYRASGADDIDLQFDRVRTLKPEEIDARIETAGYKLWRDLIPDGLQAFYAEQRGAIADKSLMVISNEPWIPWEMMWPNSPDWADDGPWCQTLRLTRWLLARPSQRATPGAPPNRLRLQRMTTIIPDNKDLPSAQEEKTFLAGFRKSHNIAAAGVDLPTEHEVRAALEKEDFDWLHAATHGNVSTSDDDGSPLWLEANGKLVPAMLYGPRYEGHILKLQPSFVFNACQVGKSGWTLRGIGGWAKLLLGANARLFMAPLWSVTDDLAQSFVVKFYQALADGAVVGEAVRQARAAVKKAGDPTWLAYSVYAHPNAVVDFAPTSRR